MTKHAMTNPVATGGGGEQFEQQVAAFALGLLLVRAPPPVLTDTSLVEVHMQTSHVGWCTDDLLLVGESAAGARRLALQVKRRFSVSAKNDECRKTILGMWKDFLAAERFEEAADQLAIVTLHGTSALIRDFGSLLHCARASNDAEDFKHRLSLKRFLSEKAKGQERDIRHILIQEGGASLGDDTYWRFLRTVNVLNFDLGTPTSQTEASVLALLSLCASDRTASLDTAGSTWAELLKLAGEWKSTAKSCRRDDLPKALRQRHTSVSAANLSGLGALVEHGQTVRDGIRSTIGDGYVVDRASRLQALSDELSEHRIVVVSGVAGSGKSALARGLLNQYESVCPVLAFQAVEFATAHVDQAFANAQTTLNLQRLLALLASHDKIVLLVDGIERLLERSIRDGFGQLMQLPHRNPSVRIVLTVRKYSLETVCTALIPANLAPRVFEVPTLSDDELDDVRDGVPALALPLKDARLRGFLRTPYLLDVASRMQWGDAPYPVSFREFRRKVWKELIRADDHAGGGMPARRGRVFMDIAWRRAVELRSFVRPGLDDAEAVEALSGSSMIRTSQESSELYAVTHDVLEDWGVLQLIDDRFAAKDASVSALAEAVGGFPALRRGISPVAHGTVRVVAGRCPRVRSERN